MGIPDFQDTVLNGFDKLLLKNVPFAVEYVVAFLIVAVIALEMSRRIERHGTLLAVATITAFGLFASGIISVQLPF